MGTAFAKNGYLNKALFYGFDEVGPEWFEAARHVFELTKAKYPDLATISTLHDNSYGINTGLTGLIDNFMPLMPRYNIIQAQKARKEGTRVWWYDTRWNIEQPLSRSRLIPWMTYKMKSDGFLIWCINRWVGGPESNLPKSNWEYNTKPVDNEIFNAWNPWLDGVTPNSSANYVYPGKNGPYSSMRLENFRDGIEDYDLLMEAQDQLQYLIKNNGDPKKIHLLEEALDIKDSFIQNATQADWRPKIILEYRKRLIDALEIASIDSPSHVEIKATK